MTFTTSNAGGADLSSFVSKAFLERYRPALLLDRYCAKDTIPTRSSSTWKKQRVENLAPITGYDQPTTKAVVEGVVPTETIPTITNYSIKMNQYGSYTRVSDVIDLTHETQVFGEFAKLNNENMQNTIERVNYAGIVAGTNSYLALDAAGNTTGSRASIAGTINAPILDTIIKKLQVGNAPFMFQKAIGASTGFNTTGILPAYIGIVESNVLKDLSQVPGFVAVNLYPSGTAEKDEVGAYRHIRFFLSNLAPVLAGVGAAPSGTVSTAGANDVFQVLVFGKPAVTLVDIASSMQVKVINPGTADSGTPLGQWGSIGWKAMLASIITNDAGIVRLECAATL